MQKVKHILFFGLIAIMLASCASSKSASTKRQTLSQKAHVGLTVDQYQYNVDCVLKVWKNELIVLSVLPMMGIEMFRLEATPEDIIVIDKFNKRYAIITYEELQQFRLLDTDIKIPTFKEVLEVIDGKVVTYMSVGEDYTAGKYYVESISIMDTEGNERKYVFDYDTKKAHVEFFKVRKDNNAEGGYEVLKDKPIAKVELQKGGTEINLDDITTLDREETFAYSLITDNFSRGNVLLDGKSKKIKSMLSSSIPSLMFWFLT